MSKSKLEEELAQQLYLASNDLNARWPYPAPVREMHPMWCCEHPKREHLSGRCRGCYNEADEVWRAYHKCERARNKVRAWRVDFAWPEQKVIVECEGVRFDQQGGRHQTGAGFQADLEKYAALELAGWHVLRVGQRQITSGDALRLIENALRSATERVGAFAPG